MPRRGIFTRRVSKPDSKYEDPLVSKFIRCIMRDGKRSVAENIVYDAMEIIRAKTKDTPLKVFRKAVDNVRPLLEVKSRRVGGSTYQVPMEVRSERRTALSIRWIRNAARARKEYTMKECLAAELMDAANNTGAAMKRKEDTHKMAEANKAFSHYRW